MDWKGSKKIMLPIQHNAYCYEIRPQIVQVGKETQLRIRPLDMSVSFESKEAYKVQVVPLNSDTFSGQGRNFLKQH